MPFNPFAKIQQFFFPASLFLKKKQEIHFFLLFFEGVHYYCTPFLSDAHREKIAAFTSCPAPQI